MRQGTQEYAQAQGMTGAVGVLEGKAVGLSARDPLDLGAHVQEDASSASVMSGNFLLGGVLI